MTIELVWMFLLSFWIHPILIIGSLIIMLYYGDVAVLTITVYRIGGIMVSVLALFKARLHWIKYVGGNYKISQKLDIFHILRYLRFLLILSFLS